MDNFVVVTISDNVFGNLVGNHTTNFFEKIEDAKQFAAEVYDNGGASASVMTKKEYNDWLYETTF